MPRYAFLPGASGDGSFWAPVRDALGAPPEAALFDWPGFGAVAPSSERRIDGFDDLATLVIERLCGPTVLVAQSMGGVVAALVWRRRPDLVSHLVLAATSGGVDTAAFGARDWRPGSRAAHPGNPEWMWGFDDDLTPVLASVRVPTLLVWGTDDPISPLAIGRHLAQLIPTARLVVYPTDDHWVAREFASEVAAEVHALCRDA